MFSIWNRQVADAMNRPACCVYLVKHKYNSEQISSLYFSLTNTPLHEDKQLLKWLAYENIAPIKSVIQRNDITRRVCFHHNSGRKDHECLLIPSLGGLNYHMLRSEYVLKAPTAICQSLMLLNMGGKRRRITYR